MSHNANGSHIALAAPLMTVEDTSQVATRKRLVILRLLTSRLIARHQIGQMLCMKCTIRILWKNARCVRCSRTSQICLCLFLGTFVGMSISVGCNGDGRFRGDDVLTSWMSSSTSKCRLYATRERRIFFAVCYASWETPISPRLLCVEHLQF